MSRVDVIVPCYNYGRFLRECVESVLDQPVDVRILIIDDASSDETPEVAADLAGRDRRVEAVTHAVNRGNIATFNEGFEWASADYTLLISADDFLVPGALSRACMLMDQHPDVGFVYGKAFRWHVDEPRPAYQPSPHGSRFEIMAGSRYIEMMCGTGAPTISPELLVRTSIQRRVGGYRQDFPHCADVYAWLRMASMGDVGYIDEYQAYYRVHGSSMFVNADRMLLAQEYRKVLRSFFEQLDRGLEEYEHLRSLGFRAEASLALYEACLAFDRREIDHCRRLIRFAVETDPKAQSLAVYSRLRWKLALGPRAWAVLKPILKQVMRAKA